METSRAPFVVRRVPNSTPILLLTDIGADIDDTFALLVAAGSVPHCHLVGVVTSVNDGVLRGSLVRGWLRRLGEKDEDVPVLPSVDPAVAGCVVPFGFPSPEESALGVAEDTPQRILDIAAAYGSDLVIVAIAPVTPLANALLLDTLGVLKRVKRVYLQGNVTVDARTQRLKPDPQAYNFRVHMGAAERLFQELQDFVPFSILGKFAAYEVGVQRKDLEALDILMTSSSTTTAMAAGKNDGSGKHGKAVAAGSSNGHSSFSSSSSSSSSTSSNGSSSGDKGGGSDGSTATARLPPSLSLAAMARDQMNGFRHGNFELWCKIYPVPEPYNSLHGEDSMQWFDHLPGGVISHPYDPLLLLMASQDAHAEHSSSSSSSSSSRESSSNSNSKESGPQLNKSRSRGGSDNQGVAGTDVEAATTATTATPNSSPFDKSMFTRTPLGCPKNLRSNAGASGGVRSIDAGHEAVGNSAESHGVPDAEIVKNALVALMAVGIKRTAHK